MHREIICPGCGQAIPLDEPGQQADRPPLAEGETVETVVPCTVCADDLRANSDQTLPGGELLASIAADRKGQDRHEGPDSNTAMSHASIGQERSSDPFLADLANAIPDQDLGDPTGDYFPDDDVTGLPNLELHSSETTVQRGEPDSVAGAKSAPDVSSSSEIVGERPGLSLGITLLGSYASAVTIALAWLLWTGWGRGGDATPTLGESSRLEVIADEGSSLQTRLPKIADDKRTPLGQPLRVGILEVTPLSIRSDRVRLISTTGAGRKDGGSEALHLRMRLRNTSVKDAVTPFDPAFVREPDHGAPESLIVADDRAILPFPLAVQSDWSIAGQGFSPLKPGEERDFVVVSAPDSLDKATPRMSWRLRVRVSRDKTELIEVQFTKGDIGSS